MKNTYLQEVTEIIRKQQGPRGPVCMCGEQLLAYSRERLVYVEDLGQIMLAKLTPTGKETKC